MVKGITKQVIVVKSPDTKLFEQAIFLIKENALAEGGITEDILLQEARRVCRQRKTGVPHAFRFLWAGIGLAAGGLIQLVVSLL